MAMRRHTTIHGATRLEIVGNPQCVIPPAAFIYGYEGDEAVVFIEPKDLLRLQREVNDAVAALRAAGVIADPVEEERP